MAHSWRIIASSITDDFTSSGAIDSLPGPEGMMVRSPGSAVPPAYVPMPVRIGAIETSPGGCVRHKTYILCSRHYDESPKETGTPAGELGERLVSPS